MVRIIVTGCAGRMGRRIASLAFGNRGIVVAGAVEMMGHSAVGSDMGELIGEGTKDVIISGQLEEVIAAGEVIIDFTSPDATMAHVATAMKYRKNMVIGTTGLSAEHLADIQQASKSIAIVCAPNMSVGVNLLFKVAEEMGRALADDYDVEIVEAHHNHKKDAPSGTALELARRVAAGRGVKLNEVVCYGREGICGERPRGQIGIHAVRGGDVIGEHTVSFMIQGERIELVHRASSRDAFAQGALRGAAFLKDKKSGLYSMQQVMGLA